MPDESNNHQGDDDQILKVWELAPNRESIQFEEGGDVYFLASARTMGLTERAEYDESSQNWQRLQNKKNRSKAQTEQLRALLNKLAHWVLPDLSDDEVDALDDFEKETAIMGFNAAFANSMAQRARATGALMTIADEAEDEEEEPDEAETTSAS